mmetsp:Transcript_39420/g.89605  ORF Transcript_39420/g.89605 Transcript_39420/m.89605 type:complete len:258 (-) Transcript_39420:2-775(-)
MRHAVTVEYRVGAVYEAFVPPLVCPAHVRRIRGHLRSQHDLRGAPAGGDEGIVLVLKSGLVATSKQDIAVRMHDDQLLWVSADPELEPLLQAEPLVPLPLPDGQVGRRVHHAVQVHVIHASNRASRAETRGRRGRLVEVLDRHGGDGDVRGQSVLDLADGPQGLLLGLSGRVLQYGMLTHVPDVPLDAELPRDRQDLLLVGEHLLGELGHEILALLPPGGCSRGEGAANQRSQDGGRHGANEHVISTVYSRRSTQQP